MPEQTPGPTPARLFALAAGAGLLLGGIGGFLFDAGFGTGGQLSPDLIVGTFPTNGWLNLLHAALGLWGLLVASRAPRTYALAAGALLAGLGFWGLVVIDHGFGSILELLPTGTELALLQLAVGACGFVAGLATPGGRPLARRPRRSRRSLQERRPRSESATPRQPS